MKLKHHSILFILTLLGTGLAPASVHVTVDRSDGSWTLGQTSNVDVGVFAFFGTYHSFWVSTVSGPSVSTSFATFTYSGIYNGNAISDTGTISLAAVSDTPQSMRLQFGPSVTSTGTFTSLSITPTSNFDNTVDWINLDDGFIDPFTPNTNNQAHITMVGVPEPAALLLGAIGSLSLLLRRRRYSTWKPTQVMAKRTSRLEELFPNAP